MHTLFSITNRPKTIALFLLLCILCAEGSDVVVTVQTTGEQNMNLLTSSLNNQIENLESPGINARMPLGALETTMSRVVDSENAVNIAQIENPPMMTLIQDISYLEDNLTPRYVIKYETLQTNSNENYVGYNRMLYFSAKDKTQIVVGDVGNICLDTETTNLNCLDYLKSHYSIDDSIDLEEDFLQSFDETSGVFVEVEDMVHSQRQIITITIPYTAIHNVIGTEMSISHPIRGLERQYTFSIGMLFSPKDASSSRIIMYDVFHLMQNTNQIVTMEKTTSYSIAKYVSFWTTEAENKNIEVATMEFTLDGGHNLEELHILVNGIDVQVENYCTSKQAEISEKLEESTCLTRYPLCEPQTLSSDNMVWVTVVVPVVSTPESGERKIDVMLKTIYTENGKSSSTISSLNFATRQPPVKACTDAIQETFDPVKYTAAYLYRGVNVELDTSLGQNFILYNDTETALSMQESLITLVLKPTDSDLARDYFSNFPSETINLDELFMSHSKLTDETHKDVFTAANNVLYTKPDGHGAITLDPVLLTNCPMQTMQTENTQTCVTTKDWDRQHIERSNPGGVYFVYEVLNEISTKDWLKTNIIGTEEIVNNIYDKTMQKVIGESHAKVYYIWPVYFWPDTSPIGLRDTTYITMTWSVTSDLIGANANNPENTDYVGSRRLLSKPIIGQKQKYNKIARAFTPPVSNVKSIKENLKIKLSSRLSNAEGSPTFIKFAHTRANTRRKLETQKYT